MSLRFHVFAQLLALVVQYVNLGAHLVPAKYQPFVALFLGVAQAVLAFVAHYSPPPK